MFIICSISVFVVQCDRDDEEKTLILEKRFHFYFSFVCLCHSKNLKISLAQKSYGFAKASCIRNCPWSFLQTSNFNIQPHVQKDYNSNENFVMGAAQCAEPMTKFSLLL